MNVGSGRPQGEHALRRGIASIVALCLVVGACSGAETSGSGSPPGPSAVPAAAGSSPPTDTASPVAVDTAGYLPSATEDSARRLQTLTEQSFRDLLAANGDTVELDDLQLLADEISAAVEADLAGAAAEIAEATGAADEPVDESADESVQGFAAAGARTPTHPQRAPATVAQADIAKAVFVVLALLATSAGLEHKGPGDYGPSSIPLGDGTVEISKTGRRMTVEFEVATSGSVAMPDGSRLVKFVLEFRLTIDACPDEQGRAALSIDIVHQLATEVPGKGLVSSELTLSAAGDVQVGDDAEVDDVRFEVESSLAGRTETDGRIQPGANDVELAWDATWPMRSGSADVGPAEVRRASAAATIDHAHKLLTTANDYLGYLTGIAVSKAEEGWSNGQCIELGVTLARRVPPGSQHPAEATVTHRYEERVLPLPVTAALTAGGRSIEPPEATGPPARYTYTAPNETAARATVAFEVRSRRGADRSTVDVATEAGGIGVTFTGTISYALEGFGIDGTVRIGPMNLTQYTGDQPEYLGTWNGFGEVELTLSSDIPGCGEATGTQTGGGVNVVGTPQPRDGQLALSLRAEDTEGEAATLSCGAFGAIVQGGGISIGAGLINLGEVVIPVVPGTYPFRAAGVAAGLVNYEVVGEAVVGPVFTFDEG